MGLFSHAAITVQTDKMRRRKSLCKLLSKSYQGKLREVPENSIKTPYTTNCVTLYPSIHFVRLRPKAPSLPFPYSLRLSVNSIESMGRNNSHPRNWMGNGWINARRQRLPSTMCVESHAIDKLTWCLLRAFALWV